MRDLIESAERAVGEAATEEFAECYGSPAPSFVWLIHTACGETVWAGSADPEGGGEPSVPYVQLTAETLAALKLFADLKAKDDDLLGRISEAISDSLDVDWRSDDGARSVMQELTK